MDTYMTTTDLRTKTPELVHILSQGVSIKLIHRSKIIGKIQPEQKIPTKIFNAEEFQKAIAAFKPKKLIPRKDRDRIYRKHLEEKYGKGISRR